MSATIENLDNVIKRLDNIASVEKMKNTMGLCAAMVEAEAKKKAPKGDTGALARSIESKVEDDGTSVYGIVFTPLLYAPYVEYGTGLFAEGGNGRKDVPWNYVDDEGNWHTTRGMQPQPYMRPALNESRTKIDEMIQEALLND